MKYIVKDLLKAAVDGMFDAIAHQTNCMHRWNSGLAPQLKERFPQAYNADLLTRFSDITKLGTCSFSTYLSKDQTPVLIANCYGQYQNCSNGGETDYVALRSALLQLSKSVPENRRIGFPKIGCGAAKGDWNIVSAMIEEIFINHDVTICVLTDKEIPDNAISNKSN